MLERLRTKLRRHVGVGIERTFVYRLAAADPRSGFAASPGTTRIDVIPAASVAILGALGPFDVAECVERFMRGDRCYGAWIGDELAHYSWVQDHGTHPIDAAGLDVDVQAGELWIYNCRTADAHRGKGIYPLMLRRITDDYFCAGARCAWIYTAEHNVASQRGIAKVGFVQTATLRALRLGHRYIALDRIVRDVEPVPAPDLAAREPALSSLYL